MVHSLKIALQIAFALALITVGQTLCLAQPTEPAPDRAHHWSASLHYGRIIKHNAQFKPKVTENSQLFELNYHIQSPKLGSELKELAQPKLGIAIGYGHLGDRPTFGEIYYLLPNVDFTVHSRKRWSTHFQMGIGAGYVTRTYSPVDNVENNVIGSHLNSAISFQLRAAYRPSPAWSVFGGLAFTHFSNGAIQLPNLGINIPTASLGFSYRRPHYKPNAPYADSSPKSLSKGAYYGASFALALRESTIPGGPKYPTYCLTLFAAGRQSLRRRLLAGLEYEYDSAVTEFSRHTNRFGSARANQATAHRLMLFAGEEVMFGRFSLLLQAGCYLAPRVYVPFPVYTKLGLRYYLGNPYSNHPTANISAHLKAHKVVAEYGTLSLGVIF